MKITFITILLVFVVLTDCTNALRRQSTATQRFDEILMLASKCPKKQSWVNGYYSSDSLSYGTWRPGYCKANVGNCKQFDHLQTTCLECAWGYKPLKKQKPGNYCTMSWWVITLLVIISVVGFMLLIVIIMGICNCCCAKDDDGGKKDKKKPVLNDFDVEFNWNEGDPWLGVDVDTGYAKMS